MFWSAAMIYDRMLLCEAWNWESEAKVRKEWTGPYVVALSFCAVLTVSEAAAAPQQALNKTITVSFGVSVPVRGSDGSVINGSRSSQRVIYVSSAGRIFTRAIRREARNLDTKEAGPETTTMSFSGNKLVGVMKFASGASQMTIDFDSSFQSCTASIFAGGEGGRPITFKGLNGVMYTTTGKMQFSNASCSIRAGNALAEYTSGVSHFICPSNAAAPVVFFASRVNASRPPAA